MLKRLFIFLIIQLAFFTSCSNDYEEDNTEARVAELRSKIYATAEEYGIKNFTVDENKLHSHLDITDGEIDNMFKLLANFPGKYMGSIAKNGRWHLQKSQTRATRYSGLYPESWSGTVGGHCTGSTADYNWSIDVTIHYEYHDDDKCDVRCESASCGTNVLVDNNYEFVEYPLNVSNEDFLFTGSIAFDYSADICFYGELGSATWELYCSYDDGNDDASTPTMSCFVVEKLGK